MRLRNRFTLPSLTLTAVLIAGSLGLPALAAPDGFTEPPGHLQALLRPAWLQTFLAWMDRVLEKDEARPTHERSMMKAATVAEEPASSDDPGFGVTPQAGPQIDPDG